MSRMNAILCNDFMLNMHYRVIDNDNLPSQIVYQSSRRLVCEVVIAWMERFLWKSCIVFDSGILV